MDLPIRKAECSDYQAVASLIWNELGYSGLDIDQFLNRMKLMEADDCYATFVAQRAGEIVGFIGLYKGLAYEMEGEYLRISALAVKNDQQGQGVGTALLKYAEEYAFRLGISTLILNSGLKRAEAHAFYEKNGFVKKSVGFSKSI